MHDIQKSSPYHPALQLIFLVLMAFVGAIVFTIIGFLAWLPFNSDHFSILRLTENNMQNMDISFLRMMQISSSLGLFIAGPIAFAYINQSKPKTYFYFDQPLKWTLFLLVISILFASNPIFELINEFNQKLSLPDFLNSMEVWMKEKELQAAELTKKLLEMRTYNDLIINLIMIAIIPAIGEELFFRGGIQTILKDWFKNYHVAIWVTAILFSAIHLQFYGFFPRMLLGALFGYLLVYGKSIWLPILGHFLNNGTAVVMAFVMQKQGKSIDEIEQTSNYSIYGYAISIIITLVLLLMFFKQTKNNTLYSAYE